MTNRSDTSPRSLRWIPTRRTTEVTVRFAPPTVRTKTSNPIVLVIKSRQAAKRQRIEAKEIYLDITRSLRWLDRKTGVSRRNLIPSIKFETNKKCPSIEGVTMYDPRKNTLARISISLAFAVLLTSSAVAQNVASQKTEVTGGSETITSLPDLTTTT